MVSAGIGSADPITGAAGADGTAGVGFVIIIDPGGTEVVTGAAAATAGVGTGVGAGVAGAAGTTTTAGAGAATVTGEGLETVGISSA